MKHLLRRLGLLFACFGLIISAAHAAEIYLSKPIKVIVPFPPGGGADTLIRLISPTLGELWKQSVIIENRPGASGAIGAELVSQAPADGYTLLMTASGTLISTPLLSKNPSFDPVNDFTPITVVFQAVSTLVVNAALPVNNVRELIEYARKNPGKVGFASPGVGNYLTMAKAAAATQAVLGTESLQRRSFVKGVLRWPMNTTMMM